MTRHDPAWHQKAQRDITEHDTDAFPWGACPPDAAVTRTSKQAGKALRSQGHQYARVM